MKKINLVLLSMMMLVLAQCTKSEIKPDPVDVSMKGEVSMGDGSKAVILPESGEINWESGDFLCFYQHFKLFVGEHPRGWSRPYAQTVATIRAHGRQQTHENAVPNL